MSETIGIVGAGLAGAVCARRLADAGLHVTVFEKSGGMGGRLSTRRTDGAAFDHGAQYLTAKGPAMAALIKQMAAAGAVAEWAPAGKDRPNPWHVGTPGMSGFVKPLLTDIDVRLRTRVASITATEVGAMNVETEDGKRERFDRVIVTAPAPQALDLVAEADPAFGVLSGIDYAPCWAVMLAFSGDVPDWPQIARGEDDAPVAWLARNTTKPGRPVGNSYVVHAGGAWSRAHLEIEPDAALARIRDGLAETFGTMPEPVFATAHRWRYARVDTALGQPFVVGCDGRTYVCGDGLLGGRAEAAVDSAMACVDHLLKTRG